MLIKMVPSNSWLNLYFTYETEHVQSKNYASIIILIKHFKLFGIENIVQSQ